MTEPTFIPTQRATQTLEHRRIVWETDNSNVIRLKRAPYDSDADPEPPPRIDFVGEGIATYEVKIIYQPTHESFPCLVSNPRFRLKVWRADDANTYLATPVDAAEMNRSSQWLNEGVRTMNALHRYWQGSNVEVVDGDSVSPQADAPLPNRIAEVFGTFVGAVGRVFFS